MIRLTTRWTAIAAAAILLLWMAGPAKVHAAELCERPRIIDGDTVACANGERVRLFGIDAPEMSGPGGKPSKRALTAIVRNRPLTCGKPPKGPQRDRYGRLLAICRAGRTDIGRELIRQGHATDYRRYSGGYYAGVGR
jgi:endonuclease YncB( thermonuclease family)